MAGSKYSDQTIPCSQSRSTLTLSIRNDPIFEYVEKLKEIGLTIYPYVRNKYIMTTLVFVVWMTFFDENNFISQVQNQMKLSELEADRDHYVAEIEQSAEDLKLLQNDKELLEKFARERYLMKKENEEIFVFATEEE